MLPGEKFQSISSPLKLANLEPEAQDVRTFSFLGRCLTSRMSIDTPAASLLEKSKWVDTQQPINIQHTQGSAFASPATSSLAFSAALLSPPCCLALDGFLQYIWAARTSLQLWYHQLSHFALHSPSPSAAAWHGHHPPSSLIDDA